MEAQKFRLTRAEAESKLWKRFDAWLRAERDNMRVQNDSPTLGIAETTLKRGEIRLANRILAFAVEAGQEARQSEAQSPESAFLSTASTGG